MQLTQVVILWQWETMQSEIDKGEALSETQTHIPFASQKSDYTYQLLYQQSYKESLVGRSSNCNF